MSAVEEDARRSKAIKGIVDSELPAVLGSGELDKTKFGSTIKANAKDLLTLFAGTAVDSRAAADKLNLRNSNLGEYLSKLGTAQGILALARILDKHGDDYAKVGDSLAQIAGNPDKHEENFHNLLNLITGQLDWGQKLSLALSRVPGVAEFSDTAKTRVSLLTVQEVLGADCIDAVRGVLSTAKSYEPLIKNSGKRVSRALEQHQQAATAEVALIEDAKDAISTIKEKQKKLATAGNAELGAAAEMDAALATQSTSTVAIDIARQAIEAAQADLEALVEAKVKLGVSTGDFAISREVRQTQASLAETQAGIEGQQEFYRRLTYALAVGLIRILLNTTDIIVRGNTAVVVASMLATVQQQERNWYKSLSDAYRSYITQASQITKDIPPSETESPQLADPS